MAGYIQIAIKKVKAVDIESMKALRKRGHRSIRFKLRPGAAKEKVPTASIPLTWIVESRERYQTTGDEKAFSGFVSDWISGWTL